MNTIDKKIIWKLNVGMLNNLKQKRKLGKNLNIVQRRVKKKKLIEAQESHPICPVSSTLIIKRLTWVVSLASEVCVMSSSLTHQKVKHWSERVVVSFSLNK